jgi:hypothetical protein
LPVWCKAGTFSRSYATQVDAYAAKLLEITPVY